MPLIDVLLVLIAAFVTGATLLTLAGTLHFFRARRGPSEAELRDAFPRGLPFVSVLKPCKGADPGLYENLASYLRLEGLPYEVLIGVADANDPAVQVAKRLQVDFPGQPVRVVVTGDRPGFNPKVHILTALTREAKGELLLVSDSNTRARSTDLLARVFAPFADPKVGATVGLVSGRGSEGVASRLEAARFNATVTPAYAAAYHMFGVGNGFGKCMGLRRSSLEALGGWEAYVEYLTEDGLIARHMRRAGMRVVVVPALVDVLVGELTLGWLWKHELRWTTGHRIAYPLIPLGEMVWNPFVLLGVAGLGALLGGSAWPVVFAAGLRLVAETVLLWRFGRGPGDAWLLPFMDAGMVCVTAAACLRNDVIWRGQRFVLGTDTRILRVEPATLSVVPETDDPQPSEAASPSDAP